MTQPLPIALSLLFAAILMPASARADVVTLNASKDNTLFQSTGGVASNGKGQHFFVGRNAGFAAYPVRRGVIAFNIAASVPAGALITDVRLNLTCTKSISGNVDIALQRLTSDWGEGTSNATGNEGGGATSTANDATWIHTFYPSTFWTIPGGDYVANVSASLAVAFEGPYTWSSQGMVADVQSWLDQPAQNFGWILRGNESVDSTAKRFGTRENSVAAERPSLVVTYVLPPQVYCSAQTSSGGCVPSIGYSGTPSPSGQFTLEATDIVENQLGVAFYSLSGPLAQPFGGGWLCIQPPVTRLAPQSSGGTLPCSGTFSTPLDSLIHTLATGQQFWIQYWYRDPGAASGTGLSDALAVTVLP